VQKYSIELGITNVEPKPPYNFADGTYVGEVEFGTRVPHGRGIFLHAESGDIYEGWRKQNKRWGKGRIIERSGLVYEGQWKDNLPHGNGQITYPNGCKF
jgi:hypothetical protein